MISKVVESLIATGIMPVMTGRDFIVRDYRAGDFAGISKLWKSTDQATPCRGDDEKTIRRSIKMGGKLLVLTEKRTRNICGTSWMTYDGRRIHLHHFGIQQEYQGRGLAKRLLRESLAFIKEKGSQVKIEVHQTNYKAINLYKKAGFAYLGDYDIYIIRDMTDITDF